MNVLSETAVAQGMVLASLIGGFTLAAIAQLVSAFPRSSGASERDTVSAAITRLAVAATIMMINVWSGIIFFLDDGEDRGTIARIFYGGVAPRGALLRPGDGRDGGDHRAAAALADPAPVRGVTRGRSPPGAGLPRLMPRVPDCVVRISTLGERDGVLLTQSAAAVGYDASHAWRDG